MRVQCALAAAVTAVVVVLGGAAPASADGGRQANESMCRAPYLYPPFTRTCTTGEVKVTRAHRITIWTRVCDDSPWRLWDVASKRVVASGSGDTRQVVTGLYGTYRAKLTNACWRDRIGIRNY
ncbi:hypothetical protein [Actinoplanes sp. RD1]|uniref:hypothetical protein n=1 Tax=Actinoplanes sp. RD1 TaxID=3064538 RepID=UPI00274229CA|nr:hypothetical protein [Actinoplanes sp. RD1]